LNCSGLRTVTWNAKNCGDFGSAEYSPFKGLTGINTFNFGNDVERIPSYLCAGLNNINSVSFGNALKSISNSAFEGCRGLTGLEFSNSLNSIGQKAFYNCRGLLSITFPNSVSNIGVQAFAHCTDLDDIHSYPNPANVTLGDDVFYEVPKYTCVLHVTPEHFDAYKKASQWKTFLNILDDLAGVEGVEVDAATKEIEGYYDLKGVRLNEPVCGQVNIVRYKDGTSQKIIMKE
ncbi:MAG: leucine-rich repeat domain-containing protein, partial [Muribaculaceae bacterium]|nr:leucine-rich repeat domain-containing protein [Muribaculaceae bacterium]